MRCYCFLRPMRKQLMSSSYIQGAKKIIFAACHSGQLKLTFTSPNIISSSPKNVLMSRLISQFFCNLNSSKNFTCPSGKLITELTSPIAKSTSPGLLDTTFFARCTSFQIALILPLLLLTPTIWSSLDHERNESDRGVSRIGTLFSPDHKLYTSDYDADYDSFTSENQSLVH